MWVYYVLIPLFSAFIGWITNVVAIKMTFFPLEFVGLKPYLGWQGIIPAKAPKMARVAVDTITAKALDIDVVISRVDPHAMAEEVRPRFQPLLSDILTEVMEETVPTLWEAMPQRVKDEIVARLQAEMPSLIADVIAEIKRNIGEFLDIRKIFIERLVQNKALLNKIFQQCGAAEFKFIERSGFHFGFLFGILQMLVWMAFPAWWILPLAGFAVGYVTNWLAIKMIFEPLEPTKFGPITWQGLFLRRQKEVSKEYSQLVAWEILNSERLLQEIVQGPGKPRLEKIIQRHVARAVDASLGLVKPVVQLAVGTQEYREARAQVSARIIADLPRLVRILHKYTDDVLDLQGTLYRRMIALPSFEFENFLRPVFKEDELKLILVGGALGLAIGAVQLLLFFSS
ncbi:MAG: hypothetical protein HYV63_01265 [Candidatus Schekmanbacteria bacterium]|nr:hypothetical protein [Candidatus Schekmanbacteria bacterium]